MSRNSTRWKWIGIFWLSLCAMLPVGCLGKHKSRPDYIFSVTASRRGRKWCESFRHQVTLRLSEPVFDAVMPVQEREITTGDSGGFVFMFMSGKTSVAYSLTCRKDGFVAAEQRGMSPPAQHHTCQLKREE